MLEPSDNGLTFEGLIDALMVSIVSTLKYLYYQLLFCHTLDGLTLVTPRSSMKNVARLRLRTGVNRFLPSYQRFR